MAWHQLGDKLLPEPMMFSLQMHICVTRPQWVIGIAQTAVTANALEFLQSCTKPFKPSQRGGWQWLSAYLVPKHLQWCSYQRLFCTCPSHLSHKLIHLSPRQYQNALQLFVYNQQNSLTGMPNLKKPEGRLNIKMSSYLCRDPHVKDKTVSWPSYL